ncbi:MAG: TIGR01777 family oxidoreductase [Solirubrobacteraceae bacterium]
MHVTVTGATGLVGSRLVQRLQARGDRVTVITRDAGTAGRLGAVTALEWSAARGDGPDRLVEALTGRDAVVNLAGAPVFQRWTDAARAEIRASRLDTTTALVTALGLTPEADRPTLLVNGSASGRYGDTGDIAVTEEHPPGDDFLATLCVEWEAAAGAAEEHGLRVAVVRTGMVLAGEGGALAAMVRPARLGVLGRLGNGRQYVPWVHLDDEVSVILAVLDHRSFAGPINAVAPAPATNAALTRALKRAVGRPIPAPPVPAPLLRLVLGERAMLVLDSSRMVSGRAEELGVTYAHPTLDGALTDLVGSGP